MSHTHIRILVLHQAIALNKLIKEVTRGVMTISCYPNYGHDADRTELNTVERGRELVARREWERGVEVRYNNNISIRGRAAERRGGGPGGGGGRGTQPRRRCGGGGE